MYHFKLICKIDPKGMPSNIYFQIAILVVFVLKQFHMHYVEVRYLYNICYKMLIPFSFALSGSAADYRWPIL